jgi:hypothetical protein
MKQFFLEIYVFLARSSKDPRNSSLAAKSFMLMAIPYLMQALGLVCAFGMQCIEIDPSLLEQITGFIADAIYYTLGLISVAGFVWGSVRKIWLTIAGRNASLAAVRR